MMNNTFTKARGAYWIAIAAASLTFTIHAVQGASSMKEAQETSVKHQAVTAQSRATEPLSIAAYRDGLYVGKLVAERGEQRAAPVGRWATQRDRDAFQAGYEQANPEIAQAGSEN